MNNVNVHARRGAAAHRPTSATSPRLADVLPPVRHPGAPVGELRRARHARRAAAPPTRSTPACGPGGRRPPRRVYDDDPRLRRVRGEGRLRGAARPVRVRPRPRRRREPARRRAAPYGGVVHWRAFVYNHRQDWRDRSTDRARAAYDHFAPLDGQFDDNVVLQVKYGPIDFQAREPVSPVIAAMPQHPAGGRAPGHPGVHRPAAARVLPRPAVERGPRFRAVRAPVGPRPVADVDRGRAAGRRARRRLQRGRRPVLDRPSAGPGQPVRVRPAAWDPTLDPVAILDEWIGLTFAAATATRARAAAARGAGRLVAHLRAVHRAARRRLHGPPRPPLRPRRRRLRVHRRGAPTTSPTATASASTAPAPPAPASPASTRRRGADVYESLETCPDELLLFFHHVPYTHVLHSGSTVIQHIYDTHFAGRRGGADGCGAGRRVEGRVPHGVLRPGHRAAGRAGAQRPRVARPDPRRLLPQSGIPDATGRTIY